MLSRLICTLVLMFNIVIMYGCATPPVKETIRIWPDPPEEPKVAYIDTYYGISNFKRLTFFDKFLGSKLSDDMVAPSAAYSFAEKIYVALSRDGRVMIIDPKGKKVTFIGDNESGKLAVPLGVAVSADGTIFVCDQKLKKIIAFNQEGKLKMTIGKKNEFENPVSISVNNDLQRLYVSDSRAHKVRVYSLGGEFLFEFGARGNEPGQFNYPIGIEVDRRNGNVIVADSQNHRVQVFSKDGIFLKTFGNVGDGAGAFGMPKSVGIDSEGNIYITDGLLRNFQIFDENGNVLLQISGDGVDVGNFESPGDIYVDEQDRIYLPDQINWRVQVYQYMSDKWKKEHQDGYNKYVILNDKRRSEKDHYEKNNKKQ